MENRGESLEKIQNKIERIINKIQEINDEIHKWEVNEKYSIRTRQKNINRYEIEIYKQQEIFYKTLRKLTDSEENLRYTENKILLTEYKRHKLIMFVEAQNNKNDN